MDTKNALVAKARFEPKKLIEQGLLLLAQTIASSFHFLIIICYFLQK